MTDRGGVTRPSGGAVLVVTAALGGFLILLAILALQMRAGHDPAFKPSVAAAPRRAILERRIIKTRVIIIDAPKASAGVATGSSGSPTAPAPVVAVRAAPVQAAPPVAQAPSPTPAPVTRTS